MIDRNTDGQQGSSARPALRRQPLPAASRGLTRAIALAITCALGALLAIAGVGSPERGARTETRVVQRADIALPPAPTLPAPVCTPADGTPTDGAAADLVAFDGRVELPAPAAANSASVDEKTLKKIAKLEKSIAKQESKIAVKESKTAEYQAKLAQALADLLAAQLLPSSTLAELKAKEKALKKATAAAAKWQKKIAAAQAKIDKYDASIAGYVAQIEALDPGYNGNSDDGPPGTGGNGDDGSSTPSGGIVNVPLSLQEALPIAFPGTARTGAVATFGLPFANGDQVGLVNGRPALGVDGSDAWQFRTLATWPDGYVKWALVDVLTDVGAGAVNAGLEIVNGEGRSGPDDLAFDDGTFVNINTGPLVARIAKQGFDLFHQVWVDGIEIVPQGQSAGIIGTTLEGALIVPKPGTVSVSIEENGPARAVVRADGALHTLAGFELLDFTCRIIARAGSKDLQVDFTVRNANINRPQHVVIGSLNLAVKVTTGAGPQVRIATHTGAYTAPMASTDSAYLYQAKCAAYTLGSVNVMGGDLGYEVVHNGSKIQSLGNASVSPAHGYADLTGTHGGVTVAYRYMPYFSPASLEVNGGGNVQAGLFSAFHGEGKFWTFSWRQHESRTVSFSFHAGPDTDPAVVARSLDIPVAGRASDYLQYDRAGVLPYRLVTIAEENAAFAAMGLNYSVAKKNEALAITRYQYAHEGGGYNNHDSIERRIGSEWLRQGFGGSYLTGMDYALYKAEWQIERSDNFHDINDPGPANPELPHNYGYQGDYEHRYMEGVILAYYLSGDPRLRDGLFDEAEILAHLINYPQSRGMYQSIRALSSVGEFTGDPTLKSQLKTRLQYFLPKTVNIVTTVTNGWGWEAAPGLGVRRFYTYNVGEYTPKPPGDNYLTRGFIEGSLGPLGLYHAARFLGLSDPDGAVARVRMRDLAHFTRMELYPYQANPANRWLVYSYGLNTQIPYIWEESDFHPLMLGLGEAFADTGDIGYLQKAVEQFQGFAAHDNGSYSNNLYEIETRLDVQHFLRRYLDWLQGGSGG